MNALRLREAIASLHRARREAAPSLTREAERSIGRRVATRWGVAVAAVTVVGAIAFGGGTALISAADAATGAASATPSPTLLDQARSNVAQVPLGGGPEFTMLDDAYLCGDRAPEPWPIDRNLALAIGTEGDSVTATPEGATLSASLSYMGEGNAGTATVGSVSLLLVRDGRIAGAIRDLGGQLSWPLQPGELFTRSAELFTEDFACKRRSAQGQHKFFNTTVTPGAYQVVAVAHVFSTPESVALAQTVPPWYRLDESLKDPAGIYAPGSYDCASLRATGVMARGCLPDVSADAILGDGGRTVSVTYDASALVVPFDVTLVSDPFRVSLATVADAAEGREGSHQNSDEPLRFTAVNDVVCGAVVNDIYAAAGVRADVEVLSRLPDISAVQPGTYGATVMPWIAPDSSLIRLEPGARLAYTLERATGDPTALWTEYEIVGFAPVELTGIVQYDRYQGPSEAQLKVGEPELCPGAENKSVRLSEPPLLVGSWVVARPSGTPTRHDVISTTWANVP